MILACILVALFLVFALIVFWSILVHDGAMWFFLAIVAVVAILKFS